MRKLLSYCLTLLLSTTLVSASLGQDMQDGFAMLEKGEFGKAEAFFEKVLASHPDNKTAKICYGRATGLNGHTEKAIDLFAGLLAEDPESMEVLLNQAEAHLWNNDGQKALNAYKHILDKQPGTFAGLLGMANSHSMLKEYPEAYRFVNLALAASPGNGQAAISKKFIILGYADMLAAQKQETDSALALLQENLQADAADQQTLQLKATVHLIAGEYKAAGATYTMLADKMAAMKGQSVALHMMGEEESALSLAAKLREEARKLSAQKSLAAQLHYLDALLWNDKLNAAEQYVDSLAADHENNPEILAAKARVATYFGDFRKANQYYEAYLAADSASFGGNLGNADALHALGMDDEAYAYGMKTLAYYPGQKDATAFLEKLNKAHSPALEGWYEYGKSSDGSYNHRQRMSARLSTDPKTSVGVDYTRNNYLSQNTGAAINGNGLFAQVQRQLYKGIRLKMKVGYYALQPESHGVDEEHDTGYGHSLADISADFQVSKSQNLTIGYYSEVQDFNQALVEQNLKAHHLVVKNAMFWKTTKLGWYSEAYKSQYSDGNSRYLVFTSVYRNLTKKPLVKTGLNYLYMSFAEAVPENYYSPQNYHQPEVFAGLTHSTETFKLQMDAAAGMQFSDGLQQPTWRVKASASRSFGRLETELSAGHSSISAVSAAGFSYSHAGVRLSYRLSERPVFFKKL